jgi:exodeoxyribonuclease VII large subunit
MITAAQHRVDERVAELSLRVVRAARYRLMQARQRLAEMSADATLERLSNTLSRRQQRVDDLRGGLEKAWRDRWQRWSDRRRAVVERLRRHDTRRRTTVMRGEWRQATQRLGHAAQQGLEQRRSAVATARARLVALSPMAVLSRGYALVFDERGVLIKTIDEAPVNSIVTTRLADGTLQTKVIGRTRRQNA